MSTDQWFSMLLFLGVYLCGLILLDGAHKTRIGELKSIHREQVSGLGNPLGGYIRTLNRERKWLENELARLSSQVVSQPSAGQAHFEAELAKLQRERELAEAQERAFDPFTSGNSDDPAHIQWLAFDAWLAEPSSSTDHNGEPTLKPPSEEYEERD